jgi:ABC-type glucose/galactose transport system permease subunit
LNLVLSFVLKSLPFIFIISISILIYHIFYKFYFSSPISKTEKKSYRRFYKGFFDYKTRTGNNNCLAGWKVK